MKKIGFVVAALLLAAGGYYAYMQGFFAREFAKEQLDAIIESMEAQAERYGVDLDIEYASLRFEGAAPPVAVLTDVRIEMENTNEAYEGAQEQSLYLLTDELRIAPASFRMNVLRITAPSPIAVRYNEDQGYDALRFTSNTPIEIVAENTNSAFGKQVAITHRLPTDIDIAAQESETASPVAYRSYFEEGSTLQSTIVLDAPEYGETSLFIKGMRFVSMDETFIQLGESEFEWQKYPNEDTNDIRSQSVASLKNLAGSFMGPLGDTNVQWNIHTKSQPSGDDPAGFDNAHMDIRKLRIQAQGASIDVSGSFGVEDKEPLPTGRGDILIANPAKLREFLAAHGILNASDEVLMDKLLKGMTGRGINDEGDIMLTVAREKEGAMMLGKLRLEDALGIVFTHNMQSHRGPSSQQTAPNPVTKE
jgi:hypothetical protein